MTDRPAAPGSTLDTHLDSRVALLDWLVFVALAGMWGSSFLFIKLALDDGLGPLSVVAYRLWIGAVVLLVVARLTGSRLPRDRGVLASLALVGLINIAIPFTLIHWSEQYIDSALAAILNGLVPLFTIGIAAMLLHDEPITVSRLLGIVVGFGGAVVLLSRDLGPAPGTDAILGLLGQLAVVLASFFYAMSSVTIRRRFGGRALVDDPQRGARPMNPVETALPQVVLAGIVVTAFAIVLEWLPGRAAVPPTLLAWFSVAWLGTFGSALAYVFFYRLLSSWGATRSTLVTYAMPVVGLVLGVLILDERVDLQVLAGTALIIGGIALVNSPIGQRRLYGRGTSTAPIARE
jgi:drug/metabolite transporter (DMT)-like permease